MKIETAADNPENFDKDDLNEHKAKLSELVKH